MASSLDMLHTPSVALCWRLSLFISTGLLRFCMLQAIKTKSVEGLGTWLAIDYGYLYYSVTIVALEGGEVGGA